MLAVTGGKGGVGKTTVTLGIAGALSRRGENALVVDADRDMPDLHRIAGIPAEGGLRAIAEGKPIGAAAHTPPDRPGVRVLPLAPGTDLRTLRTALDRVRSDGQGAIVDCPAGVGRDAALPLRVADRALIVTTPTTASLRAAAKTAAMARALDAEPLGVVCTRTHEPPPVEDLLDCPVLGCVPRTDSPLTAPAALSCYRSCALARPHGLMEK